MFYAARGSIPPKRHTQHRAPGRLALRRGAVRRRGLHRPHLPALPRDPADADPPDRGGRRGDQARGGRRRLPPPPADRRRRRRAARRRRHRPHPAVLQQRHRHGRRPPGRRHARGGLLPQRRGRRAALRPRGRGPARHGLRAASDTAPATTSSCRSARPGGSARTPAATQRMLYLECPSEIEAPKRYRNDYGQLLEHSPVLAARHPAARRGPGRGPTRASSGSTSRCATG